MGFVVGSRAVGDGQCLLALGCRGLCPMPSLPACLPLWSGDSTPVLRLHSDLGMAVLRGGKTRLRAWASSFPLPPAWVLLQHGDLNV